MTYFCIRLKNTVVVAQLVRASVCGIEGRGFEPHHPPKFKPSSFDGGFFLCQLTSGVLILGSKRIAHRTKKISVQRLPC
jgi:hypothetical protein